jgi:hypothetical protein
MKIQVIGTPYSNAVNYAKQLASDLGLPFWNEPYKFSNTSEIVNEGHVKFGGGIPEKNKNYVACHTAEQYSQYGTFKNDDRLVFIDRRDKWKQLLTHVAGQALSEKYNKKYNIKFENDSIEIPEELITQYYNEINEFNFLVKKFSSPSKIIYTEDLNLRTFSNILPPVGIENVDFKNRLQLKKYYFDSIRNAKTKKVLFIVQSEMTWNCFRSLYHELKNRNDFDPMVVVIPQVYDTNVVQEKTWSLTNEHSIKVLEQENIPYYDITKIEQVDWRVKYLKKIDPEYVFIATKDDWYIKTIFGVTCKEISKHFKMVYIPYYGATTVDVELVHTQGKGHLSYWKIIVDSPLYADLFIKEDPENAKRIIDVGHPKIEEIYKIRYIRGKWPLPNSDSKLKVIWAPHWSCPEFPDWGTLGDRPNRMKLGTFWKNCWDFYNYAKENQESVQFVFRPHPLLQVHSKIHGYYEKFEEFMQKWSELPNVYNELSGLYNDSFAASDIMITEGISFLTEYPIATGNPLIMIQNPEGCAFNELGQKALGYANKVSSFEEIKNFLDSPYELEPSDAKDLIDYLIPHKDQTSKKIIDTLESMVFDEL